MTYDERQGKQRRKVKVTPDQCIVFTREINAAREVRDWRPAYCMVCVTFDNRNKLFRGTSNMYDVLLAVINIASKERLPVVWQINSSHTFIYQYFDEPLVASVMVAALGDLGFQLSSEQEYNDDHRLNKRR